MATAQKNGTTEQQNVQGTQGQQGGQMQGQMQGQTTQGGVGSPISNEAYNVIRALSAKLEGLEAYRKYAKDGETRIWQQLTQVEVQGVQKLVDELEKLVKDGKLRLKEPGKANT